MRYILVSALLLFAQLILGQSLKGIELNPCFVGSSYSILVETTDDCESPKPFNYYLRHNADVNCDSIVSYGSSYEVLGKDKEGAYLILLNHEYENSQKRYSIYNLSTGQLAAFVEDEIYEINYYQKEHVLTINRKEPWQGIMLGSAGDTILTRNRSIVNKCDLGFYLTNSGESQEFYNSSGLVIKQIDDFYLSLQVGPNDFFGYKVSPASNVEAPVIIDSTGKELFTDKCGYGDGRIYKNPYSNQPIILIGGYCDTDDSYTIISKEKGKWKTPLYKLSLEEYITYTLPLQVPGHYSGPEINGKMPFYYTTDEYETSNIRDKKGKSLLQIKTRFPFEKIEIDKNFIYGFYKGHFALLKTTGETLVEYPDLEVYTLPEGAKEQGYYAFISIEDDFPAIYLYNIKTDELKSFLQGNYPIDSLEDLEQTFNSLEAIIID